MFDPIFLIQAFDASLDRYIFHCEIEDREPVQHHLGKPLKVMLIDLHDGIHAVMLHDSAILA
ncbi:hypothetical protein D3C74_376530 [compost metagenome]